MPRGVTSMGSLVRLLAPFLALLVLAAAPRPAAAQTNGDLAAEVSITWPNQGDVFTGGTLIKIETHVVPGSRAIASVQFFGDTNLIATATNPPFSAVWEARPSPNPAAPPVSDLRAIAVDVGGGRTESAAVRVFYPPSPPAMSVVRLIAPASGSVLAAPATFVASAELLATPGAAAPVEFLLGTNSLGVVDQSDLHFTVETPPYSLLVSNLAEGQYELSVTFGEGICRCGSVSFRVTKLGIKPPTVTPDGSLQFGVVTSFPGKQTLIEASPDLANWSPIVTNVPPGNTFTFVDPSPATNRTRFYRAVIPSQ